MEWNSLHWRRSLSVQDRRYYRGVEKKTDLSFYRVPALLAEIHEIQNTTLQMRQGRDTLHLNGVHILQWVI